ncbi:phosphoadenosine phosphosulfate reductase family protein [Amycolatopsis nigrescens]|uniref:phosphoadenosine phosphosulfate reductase domain-containing protein n=1 Tax=Amycolatopsis nigrescens TaxID=381445 RepID=UPI0003611535|nr:phosphoadenosine phosphosulfate reductase family protein [Amycolatopsis nigrescens]
MSEQADILPGMPDRLVKVPPKSREYEALTLDEAIARSHALLDEVIERFGPEKLLLLFSGGSDSSLLAHVVRERMDAAVHIRTTIAVPQTSQYVEAVCAEWGLPLLWADPPDSYEDLVLGNVKPKTERGKNDTVWRGFPGPGAHSVMYQRLKEKALDELRRSLVGKRGRTGQVAYVAGTRWSESDRRWRNANEIDVAGSVVWVSPIVHWTEGHLREYRDRHMCRLHHDHDEHLLCHPGALPQSEVSRNLHQSGDCKCGAYAHEGELEETALFYPEVAERIRALERKVAARGIPWCKWGAGKEAAPRDAASSAPGRLCSSCVPAAGQVDLLDQWVADGLLTGHQRDGLRTATAPTNEAA